MSGALTTLSPTILATPLTPPLLTPTTLTVVVVSLVVLLGLKSWPVKELPDRCRLVRLGSDHTQSGMRPVQNVVYVMCRI